jgi:hypothetical protein
VHFPQGGRRAPNVSDSRRYQFPSKKNIKKIGEASILIPKSQEETTAARKAFDIERMEIADSNILQLPSYEKLIELIEKNLPFKTVETIRTVHRDKIDEALQMMVCNKDLFEGYSWQIFTMLGIGNFYMYYWDRAFLFRFIVTKKENTIFGELALQNSEPR